MPSNAVRNKKTFIFPSHRIARISLDHEYFVSGQIFMTHKRQNKKLKVIRKENNKRCDQNLNVKNQRNSIKNTCCIV